MVCLLLSLDEEGEVSLHLPGEALWELAAAAAELVCSDSEPLAVRLAEMLLCEALLADVAGL